MNPRNGVADPEPPRPYIAAVRDPSVLIPSSYASMWPDTSRVVLVFDTLEQAEWALSLLAAQGVDSREGGGV